jgi:hypothetical protein
MLICNTVKEGRVWRGRENQTLIRAGAKASRRPLCVSIATGSRRSKTQKLFPFGHFGIPFL